MKKRFEGLICVYCRIRPADSDDHIFSRKLFAETHRANLPKAPACSRCNGQKSKLESYLTAVLPMATRLPSGPDPAIASRLAKNLKLVRELLDEPNMLPQIFSDGLVGIRTALPFRYQYFEEYLSMAAVGLAWHHFQLGPEHDHCAAFMDMNDPQAALLDQMFHLEGSRRAYANLGDGIVEYRAVQALDDPRLCVWQFRLFGGLSLGSSSSIDPNDVSRDFVVVLGRREYLEGIHQDIEAALSTAEENRL